MKAGTCGYNLTVPHQNRIGRTVFDWFHATCGLISISYSLPALKHMNQTIIKMAIAKELDGALIKPFENSTMANILVAEPMADRANFSMNYLKPFQTGVFE